MLEGELIDRPLIERVISILKNMDLKYFKSTILKEVVATFPKKHLGLIILGGREFLGQ